MTASIAARPVVELRREIGLYAATAITVGNIIGSGIFRSPHSVAQEITQFQLVLLAWVVGGILSICGSLTIAELAVTHPKTGGLYVFIRHSFGDAFGFVFGWANLWVIKPTVIASITSVFALYFCQVLHLPQSAELPAGVAAILLLTFINGLGVKQGAGTQSLFTTLKVIGIAALCAAAFLLPQRFPASLAPEASVASTHPLLIGFAIAMIPILFAYDGWTDSTYVAGEIVNPKRNLPIAIVWGTWLVIGVYLLTNVAYFHVLEPEGVAAYEAVGSETVRRLLGEWGGRALAVLVAISTFGTTNGAILTGPRVTHAMAADGLLWKPLARLEVLAAAAQGRELVAGGEVVHEGAERNRDQAVAARHGEVAHVGARHPRRQPALRRLAAQHREHRFAQVDPLDVDPGFQGGKQDAAGAAPDLEHRPARVPRGLDVEIDVEPIP